MRKNERVGPSAVSFFAKLWLNKKRMSLLSLARNPFLLVILMLYSNNKYKMDWRERQPLTQV
ncbi:MAG: hypothetical protein ACOVPB_13155, partial [Bacteroidia bacterium]